MIKALNPLLADKLATYARLGSSEIRAAQILPRIKRWRRLTGLYPSGYRLTREIYVSYFNVAAMGLLVLSKINAYRQNLSQWELEREALEDKKKNGRIKDVMYKSMLSYLNEQVKGCTTEISRLRALWVGHSDVCTQLLTLNKEVEVRLNDLMDEFFIHYRAGVPSL